VTRVLADERATEALGRGLAAVLEIGDVIALEGQLGAGKTTLARGILRGLGLVGEAPSPTFAIVQPYDVPEVRMPVWHVDLYRLEDGDVAELGLDEARADGALLVEWPSRLGARLWADSLILSVEGSGETPRRLTATVPPSWQRRWSQL
jgi:tRNA threonylcarbamoyladenosine biosynthesis protein TsaE